MVMIGSSARERVCPTLAWVQIRRVEKARDGGHGVERVVVVRPHDSVVDADDHVYDVGGEPFAVCVDPGVGWYRDAYRVDA